MSLRSKNNPAGLVRTRWGISPDDTVLIEATNLTPRTLIGIDLELRIVDARGVLRSYSQRLVGLSPNEVKQIATGLRPSSSQVQLNIQAIESVRGP